MKGLKCTVVLLVMSLLLVSCSGNVDIEIGSDSGAPQKQEDAAPSPDSPEPEEGEIRIDYRFADREEGVSLLLGNTEYYNNYSQNDLNYRMQKTGATLDEMLAFAAEQVMDFTEEEKQAIDNSIDSIESILNENGYALPETDGIIFIKTTMLEEGGAEAYTHKTEIYLGGELLEGLLSDDEAVQRMANATMCHEIFHCLTRNNPQFRKDMYGIINFAVADKDYEIGPAVYDMFISNPDVDHHNAYITLTINGEKRDCFMVLTTTKPFETEGDMFAQYAMPVFVPVDDPDTYYSLGSDVDPKEFIGLIGGNTGYTIDPEECLADNFGFALIYGNDGIEGEPYETPEIIDQILDYLKK